MVSRIILKRLISRTLAICGCFSLLEYLYFSNKAFVLTYHRVVAPGRDQSSFVQPGMRVNLDTFQKQIAFLSRKYRLFFLEDLIKRQQDGENLNKCCALTFDDGWLDNYTLAFPVLEKYRVPATIFLATGFVGTDKIFWPDEIGCYLEKHLGDKAITADAPQVLACLFDKKNIGSKNCDSESFIDCAVERLKKFQPDKREEILRYFRSTYGCLNLPRQMFNWDEAREMYAGGLIRFGAHTVNHVILNQVSQETARDEIAKSCKEISNQIGCEVKTFAYPNGNLNETIQRLLVENNLSAVTTRKGFFDRNTSTIEIPRIAIHDDISNTIPLFRSRILLRRF